MKRKVFIKAYNKGDGKKVKAQAEQQAEACQYSDGFDKITAYTICDDKGQVLGVFGYDIDDEHRAYCYALFGDGIAPCLLFLVRFLQRKIKVSAKNLKVHYVYMTVQDKFLKAQKFARLLGFKKIRDLPQFYLKENYQLFERICE